MENKILVIVTELSGWHERLHSFVQLSVACRTQQHKLLKLLTDSLLY